MGARVIGLSEFKSAKAAERARDLFESRLGFPLTPSTRSGDLPDDVLAFLIDARSESTSFLYDLIIRLMDFGRGVGFEYLERLAKMAVLEAYLALLDQLRFECLHRLGWLFAYPGQPTPLISLVLNPASAKEAGPELAVSPTHPAYQDYLSRRHYDAEVVIRQHIPKAVNLFVAKFGRSRTK